jgi:predicted lactoylglutathione lyase
MNYILDTNIPILMVKNSKFSTFFKDVFSEDSAHTFSICIVSLGEIDSIVRQNQWGSKKAKQIIEILSKTEVINLDNKEIISAYGTLDAYS